MSAARPVPTAIPAAHAAESGWVRRRAHHFDQRCR
jgi:hypothetical protein